MRKLVRSLALSACLAAVATAVAAQEPGRITGRVTSEAGAPVPSASVYIAPLNIGTITRADGTFTVTVPQNRFSNGQQVPITAQSIGFRSQTHTIQLTTGSAITQNFQLLSDVMEMEGIVATGIGQTTTRERLGVSISSVSGEEVNRAQNTSVVNALAAKAPNVEVSSSSGDAGASAYIRIRGVNTIDGDGQPLFVVDGVPINNQAVNPQGGYAAFTGGTDASNRGADINPNDIASVEILKGAAAAAIYGARAANGVVLITTKSGQAGQTRATLSTSMGLDRVSRSYPLQLRFGQGSGGSFNPANANSLVRSWGPELQAGTPVYNHFDEMYRTGRTRDTNLSVSGGTDRTSFFLSLGRLDQTGTAIGPNNYFDRTTARLKATHKLTDELTVGGNVAYSQVKAAYLQKGSNVSGLMLGALRTPPEFDNRAYMTEPSASFPRGLHRSYRVPNPTSRTTNPGFDNPFFVVNEHTNDSNVGRVLGNVSLEYTPVQWLNASYVLGNDYSNDDRLYSLPPSSAGFPTGQLTQARFTYQELDHNLVATASRGFGQLADGSLTLGFNRNSRDFDRLQAYGYTFVDPDLLTLDNTITPVPANHRYEIHSESFFGQATLNLFEQLYLTAALRNDGFSTFGASQRRHLYPKFSGAWDFTRALGWSEDNSALSFGKVRAAWGQAGNEPPVYGTVGTFTFADPSDGGWGTRLTPIYNGNGGLYQDLVAAQEDLKPERTSEFEAGLDLSFLAGRLGVGFTYYNALTRDAIFMAPLAPSSGYYEQLQNAATIRNEGVEVSLNTNALTTAALAWNVSVHFARNNNRVLDLGDPDRLFVKMLGREADPSGAAAVRGGRVGMMRGTDWIRCGNAGIPSQYEDFCRNNNAPNGAVYIAENGLPIKDPTQRAIMDPHPDWTAGLRNEVTVLTRFQLSALLDIRQGGQMTNGTKGALYTYGTHKDTEDRGTRTTFAQRYGQTVVGPGANTEFALGESWYGGPGGGFGAGVGTMFVEDASFVKLREIALSYSVPGSMASRLQMSGVQLKVSGRNLHTWTKYTGLDPEANTIGATNLRGYDYFGNPATRSFLFTIDLNR